GSPEVNPVKIQTSILREKICPIKPDFDAVIVRAAQKKQKPIVANIARLLKNAAPRRRFAVPMQNAV
ncbi:hypothetical protein MM707_29470, partial [Klebsiella pneumoniae]|nr:hypothetical protein [Klebsiella pneumoniae]